MNKAYDIKGTIDLLHDSTCYYVHCVDNEGVYTYVNHRFAESFKFVSDNMIGKPTAATMHPDDYETCKEIGKKCYENPGKLFPMVIRKIDGKGGYMVTQWEFTLIAENGIPVGIFCLGYDITEYTKVKKEISSIHKDLDSKNELLDAIAFEQSHIVRAPLANIMGLVNVLKGYNLDNSMAVIVNMLEESSIQLDDVIKNIVGKANRRD